MLFPKNEELMKGITVRIKTKLSDCTIVTKTRKTGYCPSTFDVWRTACREDYEESYEEVVNTDIDSCLAEAKGCLNSYDLSAGFDSEDDIKEFLDDVASESISSYLSDLEISGY